MEITTINFFSGGFPSPLSLFIAVTATAFCCVFAALFTFRSQSKSSRSNGGESSRGKEGCNCACSCGVDSGGGGGVENFDTTAYLNGGTTGEGGMVEKAALALAERQTGASMMEQLVPEITTHALSYLDYPSLCRLSMTNSLMRKAANDDNAWKALYHKDFTLEQDTVTPVNGWKAYYAATRAIVNINAEFFSIIREKSLPAMSRFWLNADYVKCFRASGEFLSGYNAVMGSWQLAFSWDQNFDFEIRDVRVRVLTDVAWVTMKAYLDMETAPLNMTNIFELHSGRWYMVHHHSSMMLVHGGAEQQIVHG